MTISLSNPSKQTIVHHYREPVDPPGNLARQIEIPSGQQRVIGANWSSAQKGKFLEGVIAFGGRDAAEVHAKIDRFTGLLYRDNGIISEDEIQMGHEQIVKAQEERSVEVATNGALAFGRVTSPNAGNKLAKATEISVTEEPAPRQKPTGKEMKFAVGVDPANLLERTG